MRFALAALLLVPGISGIAAEPDRLAATGQLWYAAKQFHPWLAYKHIDWNSAFIRALPAIRAAESSAEFARAVGTMLDALGDPATRVDRKRQPRVTGQHRWFDVEKNGDIVVARFRPDVEPGLTVITGGQEVEKALDGASGVIFDLRSTPEGNDAAEYVHYLFDDFLTLGRRLITAPVTRRGQRSRYLDAFEPGFRISNSLPLFPLPDSKQRTIVFVVNRHSSTPSLAFGLQAAGRGAIVFDGDGDLSTSAVTVKLPLENEWVAVLRTADIIMPDGTALPEPTICVKDGDAMEAALKLIRSPMAAGKLSAPLSTAPASVPSTLKEGLPSEGERLLAAFEIWGTFQYLSAYPYLIDEDWTTTLKSYIPRFTAAIEERTYALTVAEMVAHVKDTHATVRNPTLNEFFGTANVPAQVQFIEGKPVIRRVLAAGKALQVGDVVVRLDGRNIEDRIRDLEEHTAASTPQSMRYRVSSRLLSGADGSEAKLLIDRSGTHVEISVKRAKEYDKDLNDHRDGEVIRILPGNIGYVDLDRLQAEDVDIMFEKLRGCFGIVFDMRGYPNGTAWTIAPRLTDRKRVPAASFRRPNWTAPNDPNGEIETRLSLDFTQYLGESDKWKYKNPTVVLIDERAISQSEHTCLFLKAANGSKFVGSPTTGANGDVRSFMIPGAIRIAYTGHDVKHPDGKQLQRVGIQPDLPVTPTIAGVRDGRDEVLERAAEYLRTGR